MYAHLVSNRGFAENFGFGGNFQRDFAVFVHLLHQHILNFCGVVADKRNVAGNAARRQNRAPVPTEMALRFADMRNAVLPVRIARASFFRLFFFDVMDRRRKNNAQFIFAFTQIVFDIKAISKMCIFAVTDASIVQIQRANRVKRFAFQIYTVTRQKRFIDRKALFIFPVGLCDPVHIFFIGTDKRIRDFFECQQIQIIAPGNRCRFPSVFAHFSEFPSPV